MSINLTTELEIELAIGYGSAFTGKKRGLLRKKDLDLIIITDFFKFMSNYRRQQLVREKLGRKIDSVPLTIQEYKSLKRKRQSIINVAIKEGRILYDRTKRSSKRT